MKGLKRAYRGIPHTADLAIEVWGSSLEELFKNAGLALCDLVTGDSVIEGREEKRVSAEGVDLVDLFVNFLSELHYLIFGKGFVYNFLKVELSSQKEAKATLIGEKAPGKLEFEIKAVTYHMAEVWKDGDLWKARVVFDV